MEIANKNSSVLPGESTWWEIKGAVPASHDSSAITRHWFPQDFLFGTGTAAYQVEGAAAEGGKSMSIWDEFSMGQPWKIADGSNGCVASDMYHKYKQDIQMMKQMGFNSYRFSISWTRILPGGRTSAGTNREGIDYYNDLINTVLDNGMTPFVTLFHWDVPACLDHEYGGFLSKRIKDDFREFAEVCFWEFGDRVKHWTTLNEPMTFTTGAYVKGSYAPGRKVLVPTDKLVPSDDGGPPQGETKDGNIFIIAAPSEAYTVGRNLLLAHAEAVDLYRTKFQESQRGKIGIVLNSFMFYPLDEHKHEDNLAVTRALDFSIGWFLGPLLKGDYPISMKDCVPPKNLASFTKEEKDMVQGSIDFLGFNYYTSQYATNDPNPSEKGAGYYADQRVNYSSERNGEKIGPPSGVGWLYSVPKGLYDILIYLNDTYPEFKEIYITENGFCTKTDFKKTAKMVCSDDKDRTKYHQDHLANLLKAMKHGDLAKKMKGYFLWSWCDTFEWSTGYTIRFGLVYVDFMNNQARYPKDAAAWFATFLKSAGQPPVWFHPSWITPTPLLGKV